MDFSLLKALIQSVEQFSNERPGEQDLTVFATWLHARTLALPTAAVDMRTAARETPETIIGKLIVFMNRYVKSYAKKALQGTALSNADEFVFLISLHSGGPASKMELIQLARLEKPTGMEVLKRLQAAGLIAERPGEQDKRRKNVSLTPAGTAAVLAALAPLHEVSTLATGNLSETEKQQLCALLQKLEDFHQPLQQQLKKNDWTGFMTELGMR